ncbi:MAG TPA: peptidase M48 [Hydrogenophaga sp.]|uniref:M48 family metallopeptidase n=1 Tax=Hydrogenophaga TaxID=47420 RepID=UPI0008B6B3C7|nr:MULTISPECIES: M48 family metallopeptidase [Hydrogenophaga]MBU4182937.1 M48 family metallopeptidase [Gammaproteobacteria bacterium]OGA76551.1 MAG: peptidase M48 [Burkholderiales bacterium GWE1_65_30]OGA91467.1 MAG: peptidase M48 [Burkholderiales bacterium GWF1_66_17]OGB32193.1 MAG: peptidase M48 [Burkholderiales bacterium RIFCSPLOWO2_02_FULL_66_35]PKO78402.1 MAG: peptidase M48 [Betaproteobacteria bacterium HGW-Betaproteobacteria-15]
MESPALMLSLVFCALLVAGLITRTVLASRQIRHVARHRATVPAAFAQTITPEAHQKAADYTITKARFGLLDTALEAAMLLGWTLLGGLDWLNQTLLAALGGGMVQQLTLLAAFSLIGGLIGLPLAWWSTFRIEERFGFNKMTLSLWLGDLLKGALVGALVGLPIAALVLWLMGAAGASWWVWAWGVWMAFNLLALVLYPTLIAPLFNKFEPLQDETLKTRVNALMQRCGFAAKGLFVMDGSKRSAHANAYFTGFGAAKRVVFFDTLLQQLNPAEIDAVLAHELGHYKRRHILKRIVLMFALSLLGFALLGWVSGQIWFYTGLGVIPSLDAPNNALALLLFMMVVPLFTYFLSPLMARMSRSHEFEADAYAMAQTNGQDLASALLKLYKDNASTLTPDPVFARFYYSHPPASERIARLRATGTPA